MKTLFQRLKESNDNLERESAAKIESLFPNYKIMEDEYVSKIRDQNGNWRYDTSPHLEEIGMSHYAILKSLNFMNISIPQIYVGDPNQRYKNTYFHFGLILDTVENMARNIVLTSAQLKTREFHNITMKSKEKLLADFKKYLEKHYVVAFSNMLKDGKPIFYYPQQPYNFISILITEEAFRNEYRVFERSIKAYRNFYIHKPGVDIAINRETGQLFAIKKEFININEYRYWSFIKKSIEEQSSPHHFDNPISIVEDDLKQCLILLNGVYSFFLEEMAILSKAPNYEAILNKFDRKSYDFLEQVC